MGLLILFASLTVGISFACSLLEAALLSVPVSALDPNRRGHQLLSDLKSNRIDSALSSILILNTIANTFGAVMVGTQAETWATEAYDESAVATISGVVAAVLTLVILTCSEIIPKTLGAVYARPLSSFVGYVVQSLTIALRPFLAMTGVLTRALTRGEQASMSKSELAATIRIAASEGVLERHESRVYGNLLRFDALRVLDVMTPRTVAVMIPVESTIGDVLTDARARSFSRIPVYANGRFDDVVGYLLQVDLLRAIAIGEAKREDPVEPFMRETWFQPELSPLGPTLREFQNRREPIAMVTDEHGGLSGIVTLEDIIETILGVEILDESDRVADLRRVAAQLREDRLQALARAKRIRLEDLEG